ncbi:cyclin-dependent protein kinase inhibitor SIM [Raphanus sativus]|uniref:Cyclin-dependent protein kinase inhibitor SIM n=1 Tax=Raphanus sativus TaxID=3726 RepID=A0A6J0MSZ0_RAPSA|nr:cyclin-dependent protein kinase inhibitor SIM [Raphanus sativus]
MDLDLIQDLPMLKFPSSIKIPSNNTNIDDDGCGGCTTPTSTDHKIPPSTATTPPPPPQKRRPPPSPSSLIRSCKRKLLTPSKVEIIVNKEEIERFFSSVYNHSATSSPTPTTAKTALAVVRRRRSFRSCSRR